MRQVVGVDVEDIDLTFKRVTLEFDSDLPFTIAPGAFVGNPGIIMANAIRLIMQGKP